MKKFIKVLAAIVVSSLIFGCLAACNKGAADVELLESTERIVAIKALKTDNGTSLADALSSLKEQGKIDFDGSTSDTTGLYITSVNGYTPDFNETKEFWGVYTTLIEYSGTTYSNADYGTYDYNGTTLYSATYGISRLPLIEGEIYVLAITVSNY